MSKQEEGKENDFYKYALQISRLYLANPIGIFDNSDIEFKESQGIGDKILIRQNNVIICMLILILQKLHIDNKLDQKINELTMALNNFKPGTSEVRRQPRNKNFAVWNPETYGKSNTDGKNN